MVTATQSRPRRPAWHEKFLAMLPAIVTHARIAFRHFDPDAKAEAVQDVICNCCVAVARLAELGKLDLAYPSVLARFGVAQVKDGRKVGCKLNVRDVLSPYCQQRKHLTIERLDQYDSSEGWQEICIEDRHCGPFDVVCTKLDFSDWLKTLSRRDRRVAKYLAQGNRTKEAAQKFGVCEGRISQPRNELHATWQQFVGDEPDDAAAVPA